MSVLHIVKVANVGSKAIDIPHNGAVTTIKPGDEAVVTWEAACGAFGDPTIQDKLRNPLRKDRYAAVRAQWNFHTGFDAETEELREQSVSASGSWEAKRPKVRVTTVDTDEEITMLVDDPNGTATLPEAVSGRTDLDVGNAAQVGATIAALQDQVARLTNVLAVLDPSVMDKITPPSPSAPLRPIEVVKDGRVDVPLADVPAEPTDPNVLDDSADTHAALENRQADASALIADPVNLAEDDGPDAEPPFPFVPAPPVPSTPTPNALARPKK